MVFEPPESGELPAIFSPFSFFQGLFNDKLVSASPESGFLAISDSWWSSYGWKRSSTNESNLFYQTVKTKIMLENAAYFHASRRLF